MYGYETDGEVYAELLEENRKLKEEVKNLRALIEAIKEFMKRWSE